MVREVAAVDADLLGLVSGEIAELGFRKRVKTIEDPLLWHECHTNYDIRALQHPLDSGLVAPPSPARLGDFLCGPAEGLFLAQLFSSCRSLIENLTDITRVELPRGRPGYPKALANLLPRGSLTSGLRYVLAQQ